MKFRTQFSLRQLLLVVLFVGLGLAALRTGGVLSSMTIFLAIILTMAMAITAFVGRERLQAFAVGFSVPVAIYAAMILAIGQRELDSYQGNLPTSKGLQRLFDVMCEKTWIEMATGKVVEDYDPTADPTYGNPFVPPRVTLSESPDRPAFMSLGHVLMAMVFGYAGAQFAVAIHRKQQRPDATADRS